jgi:hypothetical protein
MVVAALAGSSAALAAAPVAYRSYSDSSLVADIPQDAKPAQDGGFVVNHEGKRTTFELNFATPHTLEVEPDCDGQRPSYSVNKAKLSAYSCRKGGNILYHIEKYGQTYKVGASAGTEMIELTILYPAAQRAYWDPIVAHMSQTLKFAGPTKVKTHG